MFIRYVGFLLLLSVLSRTGSAQPCSNLGQTPRTAFPVCGTDTFSQRTVPVCNNGSLNVPGCNDGVNYSDKNPYWYKFTCYTTGTLGFLITPNDLGDDYDWQLYDITGHNPNDVYTDNTLVVTGNWAGTFGLTGAASGGVNFINCASTPANNEPTFAQMPMLQAGHEYLLMISHFDDISQSGYQLSFGGGTAVITDPKQPALQTAMPDCGANKITVKLNKKIKCNSLAINGSDFSISPASATVIAAAAGSCSGSFDMDSLVLTLSNGLPTGNYDVVVKLGNDDNTLLDNCGRSIPVGEKIPFIVFPIQPTPLDSITPTACSPNKLYLVFRKRMDCNSIAPNGSDFVLTGPSAVSIVAAGGNCGTDEKTSIIELTLLAPIQTAGSYQVQLVNGSDGNPVIDECGQVTPAGSTISFTGYDTVSADFTYQVLYGCVQDTIKFYHSGGNGINQWNWVFDNSFTSPAVNPVMIYNVFGEKQARLIVSNDVCSDTANAAILLDNAMNAAFAFPEILCPEDAAQFIDNSTGNILAWQWDFGNGHTSNLQSPPVQQYAGPVNAREITYTVRLRVQNDHNCWDTSTHRIKKVNTCKIAVPNAFTPNSDGKNDQLYPLNAWKADNLIFRIYNRYGQVVFETRDWNRRWDGTINGHPQETGTYVWILQYVDRDTRAHVLLKGTSILIR